MDLIKLGSKGNTVKSIQYFLIGQGYKIVADGSFGNNTLVAVKSYQKKSGLKNDGVIGNATLAKMMADGLVIMPISDDPTEVKGFPKRPDFPPLETNTEQAKVFGKFAYKAAPTKDNPERIIITDDWEKNNLETFVCPQFITLGFNKTGNVTFHKKGKSQFLNLWDAWEKAKLLDRITSWEGSFNARFVRGSRSTLSNHSFASSFDINYEGNELGRVPAKLGEKNSVVELVPIAHKWGFYWGGHFSRYDAMHFSLSKIF